MVHLWVDTLDDRAAVGEVSLLGPQERARADRYHFDLDRTRFISRRVFARRVLASYLELAPDEVGLAASPLGKPLLLQEPDLHFSLSHSDGWVAVAVSWKRLVGVDIERVRPIPDALDLANGLFAKRETRRIRSTAERSRSSAFLTIWTRKESYLKAIGTGLSSTSSEIDVSSGARTGRPRNRSGVLPFVYVSLEPGEGYVGAVTVQGTEANVQRHHLKELVV
jgi:4'-phosphopantetheinyl transferase